MKLCCCGSSTNTSVWMALAGATTILAGSALAAWLDDTDADTTTMSSLRVDDAISGEWSGSISGDFPDDLSLNVTFEMNEDNEVVGTFYMAGGDGGAPFTGNFDTEEDTLTGVVTSPENGDWEMTLTLDEGELQGEAVENNSGQTVTIALERDDE